MSFSTQRLLVLALGLLGHFDIADAQAPSVEGGQVVTGIDSGWKYEDSLSIVPLHPKARTGLIDRVVEEGLISVGEYTFHRLACHQKRLENADQHSLPSWSSFRQRVLRRVRQPGGLETRSFKCIVKCAAQVIELAPCIPVALATENPAALLKCLSPSQVRY